MQLHYYRDGLGNFGDDLNPGLWHHYAADVLEDQSDALLLGIGTVVQDGFPARVRKVVMGSGAGYGPPPELDDSWDVRFVRGPLTADLLGLPPERAITDPAVLICHLAPDGTQQPTPNGPRPIGFLPHHLSARYVNWARVCRMAGFEFIDPTRDPLDVARRIASCEMVVTEALHGAIFADALRVPWVGVSIFPHINHFKWQDWFASMELKACLTDLPPLLDGWARSFVNQAWMRLRAAVRERALWPLRGLEPSALPNVPRRRDATRELAATLRSTLRLAPALSSEAVLKERVERILDQIATFRRDYGTGTNGAPAEG